MPDKHEKVIEKQLSLYDYVFDKYERYFVSSKTKDTYLSLANYNKWSVRIASHVLNNKSSNKPKEKVCKKVFDKLIKKKNPVFNFEKQAIYVEKYTMENVSYKIAIYAHQGGLTLDYKKISLKSMSDLANSTYIKAGYTQKYGLLVFYNEKQEPVMTIQIATNGDPKQSTIKWINYLGIVTKTDIQEANDKPIFDKIKENLLTITQLMLLWNNEKEKEKISNNSDERILDALTTMEQYLGNKYKQETNTPPDNLRTAETADGTEKMDCSEFVSRYLKQLGLFDEVPYFTTGTMASQNFINENKDKITFIEGSNEKEFKDIKAGDIFVWRRKDGSGHTGVVVSYDAEKDVVEVMEALGFSGSRDNSRNKDVCIGCVRKAKYKRDGAALAGMVNLTWFGYYRPKL